MDSLAHIAFEYLVQFGEQAMPDPVAQGEVRFVAGILAVTMPVGLQIRVDVRPPQA